jgi:hypothetical protein
MQAPALNAATVSARVLKTSPNQPRVSQRTFNRCLNALYVNTQMLTMNVDMLHQQLYEKKVLATETTAFLSRFHLDLIEQSESLHQQLQSVNEVPAPPQEWPVFAKQWRIQNTSDLSLPISLLLDSIDLLMELYESILPVAAGQSDHGVSCYMLAGQLVTLNGYWRSLQFGKQQLGIPTA